MKWRSIIAFGMSRLMSISEAINNYTDQTVIVEVKAKYQKLREAVDRFPRVDSYPTKGKKRATDGSKSGTSRVTKKHTTYYSTKQEKVSKSCSIFII